MVAVVAAYDGLFLDHFSAATIEGNLIRGNRAGDQGGGITIDSSDALIAGNIIQGNRAAANAGVFLFLESSPILVNDLIANNVSDGRSGGMGVDFLSSTPIVHNTIVDNSSSWQPSELDVRGRSTVSPTNTILWGEGRTVYVEEPGSRVMATHSTLRGGLPGPATSTPTPSSLTPPTGTTACASVPRALMPAWTSTSRGTPGPSTVMATVSRATT